MLQLPEIFRVRQKFEAPRVADVADEVRRSSTACNSASGSSRARAWRVTVGSRGIANIHVIARAIVDQPQAAGGQAVHRAGHGQPRRRHGRRTARGARSRTASPRSSAAARSAPAWRPSSSARRPKGFDVHFDRHAFEADHVVVCNRVKPHTDFVGDIESGLMKMMLIGLGKHEGAKIYHRAIQDYSFGQIVRSVAGRVLERAASSAGLAIVENGYDETAAIEAVRAAGVRSARKGTAGPGQEAAAAAAVRAGRSAGDRRDRQEHQRHRHGHQRRRPQVSRRTRPASDEFPKVKRIIDPRADRGHARQRLGHRPGRVLHDAAPSSRPTSRPRGSIA